MILWLEPTRSACHNSKSGFPKQTNTWTWFVNSDCLTSIRSSIVWSLQYFLQRIVKSIHFIKEKSSAAQSTENWGLLVLRAIWLIWNKHGNPWYICFCFCECPIIFSCLLHVYLFLPMCHDACLSLTTPPTRPLQVFRLHSSHCPPPCHAFPHTWPTAAAGMPNGENWEDPIWPWWFWLQGFSRKGVVRIGLFLTPFPNGRTSWPLNGDWSDHHYY